MNAPAHPGRHLGRTIVAERLMPGHRQVWQKVALSCLTDRGNDTETLALLGSTHAEDDARRLVACWNALVGIPTEEIEFRGAAYAAGPLLLDALIDLRMQVNEFGDKHGEAGFYTGRATEAIHAARGDMAPALARLAADRATLRIMRNRRVAAEMRHAADIVIMPPGVEADLREAAAELEREALVLEQQVAAPIVEGSVDHG